MEKKSIQPLMRAHLPLVLLGTAVSLYGLLTAVMGSWFSNQAMTGVISAGEYRSRVAAFDQTGGLLAGLLFLVLFIVSSLRSNGNARTAFAIAAAASFSPALAPRAEDLLFRVIGLPTMSAGSVLAGAVTALLFALPLTVCFIILASGRRIPIGCRWLSLASIFIVLGTALYPIFATVMAFLIKPGDPAVGQMIEASTTVIKLRYILLGACLLLLAFLSMNFARPSRAPGQAKEISLS